MRKQTPRSMPDLDAMASANECTGALPALDANKNDAPKPRARLKRRAKERWRSSR